MTKIYSYVLRYDDGAAPNPYGGICTLAICKPIIRKAAKVGDWIIGTGSLELGLGDRLVYAMKVSEVMTFESYDNYCREKLTIKIPLKESDNSILLTGDCIYDYSAVNAKTPVQRAGVHHSWDMARDLKGMNVLLSNHFYYFGNSAIFLPTKFLSFQKRGRAHKIINDCQLIGDFEEWISHYELNKLYDEPQKKNISCSSKCSSDKEIHSRCNFNKEEKD